MRNIIVTGLAALALSVAPAMAGGKVGFGGGFTFDGSATGGFSAATKSGKSKSQASNENYGQSETSAKNGKVKSQQASGSMSTSSSSAKNNGAAASASGGFGAAVGVGVSASSGNKGGKSKGGKKK